MNGFPYNSLNLQQCCLPFESLQIGPSPSSLTGRVGSSLPSDISREGFEPPLQGRDPAFLLAVLLLQSRQDWFLSRAILFLPLILKILIRASKENQNAFTPHHRPFASLGCFLPLSASTLPPKISRDRSYFHISSCIIPLCSAPSPDTPRPPDPRRAFPRRPNKVPRSHSVYSPKTPQSLGKSIWHSVPRGTRFPTRQ